MNREQFTFYKSFFESIKRIKNKAARADAYDAICAYALFGEEPKLDKLSDAAAIVFIGAKPVLDAAKRKAENGKQKGSKREANEEQTKSKTKANEKQNEANEKQNEANEKQNANKKEKENKIEKEIENKCYINPLNPPKEECGKKAQDAFTAFAGGDSALLRTLRDFEKMRREIKKPLTDAGKERITQELKSLSGGDIGTMIKILDQSIMHSWKGVFPLKGGAATSSAKPIKSDEFAEIRRIGNEYLKQFAGEDI